MTETEMGPHIWKHGRKHYVMVNVKRNKIDTQFQHMLIALIFTFITKVPVDKLFLLINLLFTFK